MVPLDTATFHGLTPCGYMALYHAPSSSFLCSLEGHRWVVLGTLGCGSPPWTHGLRWSLPGDSPCMAPWWVRWGVVADGLRWQVARWAEVTGVPAVTSGGSPEPLSLHGFVLGAQGCGSPPSGFTSIMSDPVELLAPAVTSWSPSPSGGVLPSFWVRRGVVAPPGVLHFTCLKTP
jgi:hypothetical protein